LIWQPELVENFVNADPEYADPPADLDTYFETHNERVTEFLERVDHLSQQNQVCEMQKYLLGTMAGQGIVGLYSNFHEYSSCIGNYKDPMTKLLAYM